MAITNVGNCDSTLLNDASVSCEVSVDGVWVGFMAWIDSSESALKA
jgi:hypothetical protein